MWRHISLDFNQEYFNFGYSHEYVCHFNYVTVTLLLSVIPCDIDSFLTMES